MGITYWFQLIQLFYNPRREIAIIVIITAMLKNNSLSHKKKYLESRGKSPLPRRSSLHIPSRKTSNKTEKHTPCSQPNQHSQTYSFRTPWPTKPRKMHKTEHSGSKPTRDLCFTENDPSSRSTLDNGGIDIPLTQVKLSNIQINELHIPSLNKQIHINTSQNSSTVTLQNEQAEIAEEKVSQQSGTILENQRDCPKAIYLKNIKKQQKIVLHKFRRNSLSKYVETVKKQTRVTTQQSQEVQLDNDFVLTRFQVRSKQEEQLVLRLEDNQVFFCGECLRYVFGIEKFRHYPRCQYEIKLCSHESLKPSTPYQLGVRLLEMAQQLSQYTQVQSEKVSKMIAAILTQQYRLSESENLKTRKYLSLQQIDIAIDMIYCKLIHSHYPSKHKQQNRNKVIICGAIK